MCNFSPRALLAIVIVTAFTACSPALDWREMPAADGTVRVAFPARPKSETRPLSIAGEPVPFTLTAATVKGAVFAVGYLDLPASLVDDEEKRQQYKQALEDSLARNLQAEDIQRRAVSVRHAHGQKEVAADELELHGEPADTPTWMLARVLLVENRLIEVAAVGPEKALTPDAARTFVDSLRVQ